jgi:aspartate-semialdehyde dehydrogenase
MTRAKWLLIGGETLAGKEIRELVEARKLPIELVLASAEASERILTESDGELFVIAPLDAAAVEESTVIILAGATATHRLAREMVLAAKERPVLVDATGALEDLPEARLCAPVLEHMPGRGENFVYVPAHPAALALARILKAMKETPAVESVATVFEPASERGKAGIDELHRQTINLFNFQNLPKEVFDAQAAFNLLPRWGDDAPVSLDSVQSRIEDELASLTGPLDLIPSSVRLVHAPVFHSYVMSVWLRFESSGFDAKAISKALAAAGFEVRDSDVEPGSNSGVAGQSGITVSDVIADRANPRAFWLWVAFDNLRARADNALLTAALLSRELKK